MTRDAPALLVELKARALQQRQTALDGVTDSVARHECQGRVRLGLHRRAGTGEDVGHRRVPQSPGEIEGAQAIRILAVHVGTLFDQQPHDVG